LACQILKTTGTTATTNGSIDRATTTTATSDNQNVGINGNRW
jgi:hypothetical protein